MKDPNEVETPSVGKVEGSADLDAEKGTVTPKPIVYFWCECGNPCRTVHQQGVTCQECGKNWKVR